MKFEVGERVQFIEGNEVKTGKVLEPWIDKAYRVETKEEKSIILKENRVAKLDQPKSQSEKVKKINEIMLELIHRKDMDILSDDDITKMLIEALDIVNTLDEPKPVVVPKFVADWLEEHKESPDLVENYTEKDALANTIQFTIYCLFADFPNTNPDVELRKPVCEWLEEDRSNYFKLIDAVRNGYVVEEEKKYYVKLPGRIGYLRKSIGFPTTIYKTDADQYTEKEIKKLDERYWAFAVPVEEVEAE
ncbi:TPA: DUF1642 domain-containing protein [Listeria monocytogenes]|nr:DUF1642 domain-containing protein [Listeria monocytogenes]